MNDFAPQVQQQGFALVSRAVPEESLLHLEAALKQHGTQQNSSVRRRGGIYAIRNLLAVEAVRELCRSPHLRRLVEPILGRSCFAVRGILFDKTPGANWKVPWHQDLSIAVRQQIEFEGFGAWSQKAGVTHVQPPIPILETMLALRLHLDDCDLQNGPLRVRPGSHLAGRLDAAAIQDWKAKVEAIACTAKRGEALLMRPLLLHASSASQSVGPRRVVHLEWAASSLPGGLEWFEQIQQIN